MPKQSSLTKPEDDTLHAVDALIQRCAVIVAAWTERGPAALAELEDLRPGMVGALTRLGVLGRVKVGRRQAVVPVRIDAWLATRHAAAGGATGGDLAEFYAAQRPAEKAR